MSVVNSFHQHLFGKQQSRVRVMIPKRILVIFLFCFSPQLQQRTLIAMVLEVIDHPTANDSINEPESVSRRKGRVGDDMNMVRHDYVCVESELA